MAGEWREVQLGEVADIITGYPFKSQHYTAHPGDPRLVGGDNIVQGSLRWDNIRRWSRSMVDGLEPYWLAPGDVVLAMDRPWIEAGLKRAAVGRHDLPALLVQRTARLRGTAKLETAFLRYLIGSRAFTEYVLGVQTGTAVPHISPAQIRAFRFQLPNLRDQRAIAHVLGTLDDKIELNRRMSETLEAMARALFKSWFVDFDPVRAKAEGRQPSGMDAETAKLFPSEFVESEFGQIPKGWTVEALDNIADFRNGLALQNFRPAAGERGLPVVKIAQLRTGRADSGEWARANIHPDCILDNGDVVFSWSGSLIVVVWCGGRAALNQHLFRVTSNRFPKWFYLRTLFLHLPEFQRIAGAKATTMGHIQRHHLTAAKCVIPTQKILEAASGAFTALLEKRIQLDLESRTLALARNELLPRLLSGELDASSISVRDARI
jgi:type I restriction enzyme, S subunit